MRFEADHRAQQRSSYGLQPKYNNQQRFYTRLMGPATVDLNDSGIGVNIRIY